MSVIESDYIQKLFLFIVLSCSLADPLFAQEQSLKLIEKQKFEKVEKNLKEDLEKDHADVEANFIGAILYMSEGFTGFEVKNSYDFLLKSKSSYNIITDTKKIEKLNKVPINDSIYTINLDSIGRIGLEFYKKKKSIPEYEYFIRTFTQVPQRYLNDAEKEIHLLAYELAANENTENSYDAFLKKYPGSLQFKEARTRRNKLGFEFAQIADNISSYKEFIRKYPDASEVSLANKRIEFLAFEIAKQINSSSAFAQYVNDFPNSDYEQEADRLFNLRQYQEVIKNHDWTNYRDFVDDYPSNSHVNEAKDSLLKIALETKDLFALEYIVKNLGISYYQRAIFPFYSLFSEIGTIEALEFFRDNYDETGVSAQITKEIDRYYEMSERNVDEDDTIKYMAPNDVAYSVLLGKIEKDVNNRKWTEALKTVKLYQPYFGTKSVKYNQLLEILQKPFDTSIKVSKFGPSINTTSGDEYCPVITGDDNTLFFCGRNRSDNFGGEDIFFSEKVKGQWTPADIVYELSDAGGNEAPVSVSTDGNKLVLFVNGDLFYSEKSVIGWESAESFSNSINSTAWDADGIFTGDGKAFLFSSRREGGYDIVSESLHSIDIYVSQIDENGEWQEPVNLGNMINTPYDDRSPFLHPDMKTLYFSSNGLGGLGGYDVYRSTRLADSCWTCWSEPINMGKEINTTFNDWGYKISTNGDRALFAKTDQSNDEDIKGEVCWLNLPNHLRPDYVATVSGNLKDSKNLPVSATIRWEDLSTGKIVGESKTDPKDGSFFIVLPLGKIYGYYVDNDKYFPLSNNLDLRTQKSASEVNEDIDLVTFQEMIENGTAVPVNNLFFPVAKSDLLPYSIPELKRVSKIITQKGLKIEISGHTDSDGDDSENLLLSQKRAESVKSFLIKEGVPSENIKTVGYGESKPILSNETEGGKAKNRRVEIRFIE
jgi:outer membrane protein OmpA-like peptidoglycan-associated protein